MTTPTEKLPFDEWFKTWPKASQYDHWSRSQGTGLRRAHSLMRQASEQYKKYLTTTKQRTKKQ